MNLSLWTMTQIINSIAQLIVSKSWILIMNRTIYMSRKEKGNKKNKETEAATEPHRIGEGRREM